MSVKIVRLFILLSLIPLISVSQSRYFTREGHVYFKSEAKVELIEANNYKVTSVIDFETGNIEFVVLMKAFEFKKALMEEHFNENYLESNDYPKSTFKGIINHIDSVQLGEDGIYEVEVEGELLIHGVTQSIKVPAIIKIDKGIVTGEATFNIVLADYDIKIPSVVVDNIAKEIAITINLNYKSFER